MQSYCTLIVPPFQTDHKQPAGVHHNDPVLLRKVNVEVQNKTFFFWKCKRLCFTYIFNISDQKVEEEIRKTVKTKASLLIVVEVLL